MSDFPSDPFVVAGVTQTGDVVDDLNAINRTAKQGLYRGLQPLEIASGSITPADGASGSIEVEVEGGVATTDDLTNIAQTNIPDGHSVCLQIADNGRAVVVKHNAGGTGDIQLVDELDFEMNRVGQRLTLQREGTTWIEVSRSGREKEHVVGAGGEPAFQNSWTASTSVRFWKDEMGLVHLAGAALKTAVASSSSAVFTLPAGYRPTDALTAFPVVTQVDATVEILAITVSSAGVVTWFRPAGAPSSDDVTIWFDGMPPFRATQ